MKILFIDYLSPEGHINFNNIHLNALCDAGYHVDTAFRQGYADKLISKGKENIEIPEVLYVECNHKLSLLFQYIKRLRYIKKHIDKKYDVILFSSYVIMPHLFFNFGLRSFLINHYNLCFLNKRKILTLKLLSKDYIHIVLNESIKKYVDGLGLNAFIVRHGLLSKDKKNRYQLPSASNIIFSPTHSMLDETLVKEMIQNEKFLCFLNKNNLKLVVKGQFVAQNSCIEIIGDRYLSEDEYYSLFLNARFILLPYSASFKYRVSAPMLEAFAYEVPLIVTAIDAFFAYKDYFSYNPYFSTIDGFIEVASSLMEREKSDLYRNLDQERPDWTQVF